MPAKIRKKSKAKGEPPEGVAVSPWFLPLLSEFIHEWGNALHTHSMWVQSLKKKLDEGGDARKIAAAVADSTQKLLTLFEDLRSGRTEVVNAKRFCLNDTMKRLMFRLQLQAKKKQLTLSCVAPKKAFYLGDEEKLARVFHNILLNAIEAAKPKSTITCTILQQKALRIRIENFGPGIRPGHRGRLFKPYFSTKSRGEMRGLGLFIAREIVTAHGGKITLESANGKTAVTVSLPT